MKKYIAGTFGFNLKHIPNILYYTDDFEVFYNAKDRELSTEDLKEWALCLNSPWSQIHKSYTITCNCDSAYIHADFNKPLWRCEYTVMVYNEMTVSIFGYGDTETEALRNCKNLFKMLQNKYNATNESI